MEANQSKLNTRTISARELLAQVQEIPIFHQSREQDLDCLEDVELVDVPAGALLFDRGDKEIFFWILLSGEVRVAKPEDDGGRTLLLTLKSGDTFGEVPLLTGIPAAPARGEVMQASRLVRISPESFWSLMGTCPVVRSGILSNMGRRLEVYQALTLHREKLISLGTLAAGLMHELNNPGTAARRASAQLRENLVCLQQISLRLSRAPLTPEQKDCMRDLQEMALKCDKPVVMNTLDQADMEEELLSWLEGIGVEHAEQIAPTLASVGWHREDIECARSAFTAELFSDALNWLTALLSSMQLVGTIEESIARVTDLVIAVKKYAYDDKNREREIDIHDSIQSTLTILAHKFRHKQIAIEKRFAPEMPRVKTKGAGLSQVWTNILDNAIDASPEQGKIVIRTWTENGNACIGIADQGPGVPPEHREQIFDPFFTTKPAGVGTGLGLDIAQRIIVGQFGGSITFTSDPGNTEFVVRVPAED
ncbi:MAG: cyclic nucleotide-binding domain-containing protein [Silvibacterium sp.]|nr:cyclic nucleotide-binding domain-containing protein [Silvibacterium sp.]